MEKQGKTQLQTYVGLDLRGDEQFLLQEWQSSSALFEKGFSCRRQNIYRLLVLERQEGDSHPLFVIYLKLELNAKKSSEISKLVY